MGQTMIQNKHRLLSGLLALGMALLLPAVSLPAPAKVPAA